MDLSPYVAMPGGWEVKALTLGIIAKKIFVERMLVRKREELFDIVNKTQVVKKDDVDDDMPMPWLIVDECLPYNSQITTNIGIVEIGDIIENESKYKNKNLKVLGYDKINKKFDYFNITKTYKKNIREIIEITTETGNKIKCTPDHKVLTDKSFVEAKDAENLATPIYQNYSQDKKCVIARLIGHLYGDGWLSNTKPRQAGFSSNQDTINLKKLKMI